MSDLETDLGKDFPEGWRPKEGDKIVGTVTNLSRAWSDYTESWYPIVVIKDETSGEEVALHCFHYVLNRKMKELKPKVGERIGVIMKGTTQSKDGRRSITIYDVKVEGRTVDPWADDPAITPAAPINPQGGVEDDFTDF